MLYLVIVVVEDTDRYLLGRCGVLVVSHGDTLQILQTVVHAALATVSSRDDGTLSSHFADAICTPVLSTHRNYALLTGQLRRLA